MKRCLLTSVMTMGLAASPVFAHAEALKIAFIETMSGPTAQTSIPYLEGIRYGVKKINDAGGFNGEPVVLMEYDNAGDAATTTDRLRAAISADARIIVQSTSSAIAAQISDYIKRYNIRNKGKELIFFNPGSESHTLVAEKCNFWYFKFSSNPFIRDKALVPTMKERGALGSAVYSINQNYSYGQEYQKAQADDVARAGSKIVGAVLHDVSKIQDFSPYVAQIKESGADTVLSGDWGNDVILLMRAIGASGLKVTVGNCCLDTTGTLSTVGHAAIGAYLVKLYNLEGGGDKGKAFNEDFKSVIGHYPYNEEPTPVFAMMLLANALASARTARPQRQCAGDRRSFRRRFLRLTNRALVNAEGRPSGPLSAYRVRGIDGCGVQVGRYGHGLQTGEGGSARADGHPGGEGVQDGAAGPLTVRSCERVGRRYRPAPVRGDALWSFLSFRLSTDSIYGLLLSMGGRPGSRNTVAPSA